MSSSSLEESSRTESHSIKMWIAWNYSIDASSISLYLFPTHMRDLQITLSITSESFRSLLGIAFYRLSENMLIDYWQLLSEA